MDGFNVEATLKVDSTIIMKTIHKHILWWFAFPFVAIINGTLRELTYKKFGWRSSCSSNINSNGNLFLWNNFLFHFQKMEN